MVPGEGGLNEAPLHDQSQDRLEAYLRYFLAFICPLCTWGESLSAGVFSFSCGAFSPLWSPRPPAQPFFWDVLFPVAAFDGRSVFVAKLHSVVR